MKTKPVILMRASLAEQEELETARRYFDVIESRADIQRFVVPGKYDSCVSMSEEDIPLVIPRYSALPYHKELEVDVTKLGGALINTTREHAYVADLQNYYHDLEDLTPETWFRASDVPPNELGPFILKGATNSRKHLWKTHMFAQTYADIATVMQRLYEDPLISEQGVYVRRFEHFYSYGINTVSGQPVTDEYRYFVLDGQILAHGFYWSDNEKAGPSEEASQRTESERSRFVEEVIGRVKDKIRFFVVDIARISRSSLEAPIYRVVELNDGTMSGLSCVDPDTLYKRMRDVLSS